MAKPNPQTGHGPLSGATDESSLAHGEGSRSGAEGDGDSEGDWDVPATPDNSPLSRILGLVLVVVLAGVFSFVAYRKYDEARRNPSGSQTVDATGGSESPADPLADSGATRFAGDESTKDRANSTAGTSVAAPKAAGSFARNNAGSADAFGSLDDAGTNRAENASQHNPQHDHAPPGTVALTQTRTAGNSSQAAAHEPDANPFGDLGASPERQPQQPPTQSEPPQQFAGGTPSSATPIKAETSGRFPTAGSQNFATSAGAGGMPQAAGGPHAAPAAGADADIQNLFPNESHAKHDRSAQNPQNLTSRGDTLQPTALTRTAEAQRQSAQNPPTQSEPLDNELSEQSRSATEDRGVVRMHQDPNGPKPQRANAGVPSAGRAEALLGNNERTPSGEESAFGSAQLSTAVSQRPNPQAIAQPHSSGSALSASSGASHAGDVRPSTGSDDPFGGNRPSASGGFGDRSGASAALEGSVSQSARPSSTSGIVSPVGTTSDAGDYYVVQPADNFWTISRKKYGTSRYFQALAELNKSRIPDPARMRPGMKVSTPSAEILEERYAQFLPPGTKVQVTAAEDASAKAAPTGFFVSPDGTPKYRTSEKDTLSDIAARHLGRSSRWIQIYEMNRDKLSSPNQVKVGTELALPGDASNVALSGEDDDRR